MRGPRASAVGVAVAAVITVLGAGAFAAGSPASAQGTDEPGCITDPASCHAGTGTGGGGRPVVRIDLGGRVHSGPNNICTNGLVGEWKSWEELGLPYPAPDADEHPGETFWVLICSRADGQPWPSWLDAIDRNGWSGGGPPAAAPTPADILPPLWAEVQTRLHNPTLAFSPPGQKSKVGVPTFVAITNPQVPTRYEATVGAITVWIDVDPTATLHPGEPNAGGIPCGPAGSRFDPDGPEPKEQARGACAHTYRRRTGVGDRPDAWTGDVTLVWTVEWGSTVAGTGGPLDAPDTVTPFGRGVGEIQGVVVEAGG